MNTPALNDEGEALRRLLGSETVATPEMLARGLTWLCSKIREEIQARPAAAGQVWGTVEDFMVRYGWKKSQAHLHLTRLAERGAVRIQKPNGADKRGTYYNIADVEKAWSVERGGDEVGAGNK